MAVLEIPKKTLNSFFSRQLSVLALFLISWLVTIGVLTKTFNKCIRSVSQQDVATLLDVYKRPL